MSIHKCARHGKALCVWCFAQSMAFPIEHLAWERLPLLRSISHLLGV